MKAANKSKPGCESTATYVMTSTASGLGLSSSVMNGDTTDDAGSAVSPAKLPVPTRFVVPEKRISTNEHLQQWKESQAYHAIHHFLLALNESVKNKPTSVAYEKSEGVDRIGAMLDKMSQWVDEIPPTKQPMRFGNASFRTWLDKVNEESRALHLSCGLPDESWPELHAYFMDSFGNRQRIDYGTGHELNFLAWLFCAARLGVLKETDKIAIVFNTFMRYLSLMRKLQTIYWLEPAGSKGVWGLDDYQFLPFIFGSAQLYDHKNIKPSSVTNALILEGYSKEYIYLDCIQFILKIKKGIFAEHSPILNDISGVPNWQKVNSGLIKMYIGEVLMKLPVIQHFLFGSLLSFDIKQ